MSMRRSTSSPPPPARARPLRAARLATQLEAAGLLEKVERIVKLGAFINCTADFTDQPEVANGASDLMEQVFGDTASFQEPTIACFGESTARCP